MRKQLASKDHQNTDPSSENGGASQSTPSKKKAGKKGNSGSSKKMTAKEQSERFVKTARELGAEENGKHFSSLLNSILSARDK